MDVRKVRRFGVAALVLVAGLFGGCAHRRGDVYGTRVEAFVDPVFAPKGAETFCFMPPDEAHADGGLSVRSRYDELARVCAQVAITKGVPLAQRDCLPMRLDWAISPSNETTYQYNYLTYAASARGSYRKALRVSVFSRSGKEPVVEATAWMLSKNVAFTDRSAEVLCRAIFHEFPARLNHKRYNIRVRTDRPVPFVTGDAAYRQPAPPAAPAADVR